METGALRLQLSFPERSDALLRPRVRLPRGCGGGPVAGRPHRRDRTSGGGSLLSIGRGKARRGGSGAGEALAAMMDGRGGISGERFRLERASGNGEGSLAQPEDGDRLHPVEITKPPR